MLASAMASARKATNTIPSTMKVAIANGFGEVDENIFIREDWPTPQRDPDDNDHLIIRVLACALAPGDVRILSGKTDYVQLPESGHPYVIGSDVSGIVVDAPQNSKFKVGDYVVSRFDLPRPIGGVAEYRLVRVELTEKCPQCITPIESCGLPASAMAAKLMVRDYMKKNDRVLVIGGSGAVGSSVLQYSKLYGSSFLAAVSTQDKLCKKLGADQAIDYRTQKWWNVPEFESSKFDIVFDLVNGDNWTVGAHIGRAIKRHGTYVALLSGVETELEVHGKIDMIRLSFLFIGRMLWSRLNPFIPSWVAPDGLVLKQGDLEELFDDVAQGRLKPLLHPSSPFDFTQTGVREAMSIQKSRHAHGKVVVKIHSECSS